MFRVPRKIAQTLKQNFVEALTYVDYRLNLDSGQVQLSPERIKIVFRDQEFYSEYVVDGTELQWQIQNQQY